MSNNGSKLNLPPVWNKVQRHAMMPELNHDEIARYNFLANLNRHLSTFVAPGNKVAFDKRVQPQFMASHGRDFVDREEVKEAMENEPVYQTWSALRRATMEMRQQAGRSVVLRQAEKLADKAKEISGEHGSLVLNTQLEIPHYISIMDNHIMPGSYHTELFPGDVSGAASYDSGIFVTTGGMLGKLNDGGGKAIAFWLKEHHSEFAPKRILDIGCGLGHNVLPIAQVYPDAEIIAIDVGAPMLRYGHARAKALGIDNVKFMQLNAENTGFADESFDWIQTTMFLHETSYHAIYRIMREIYRMLKPGGLTMHIEQPQYTPDMSLYEQFMRDWDAYNNNEPFWGVMHDIDPAELMAEAGFKTEHMFHTMARAVTDDEMKPREGAKEVEDYGRAAIWNVFGAWKK